jgi:CRISPR-associated protein Cas2
MVILLMEKVPVSLRGELSRWMIEPKAGVFVGKMSAMVRDRLWEHACKGAKGGGAMLFYSSQTEQGFTVRSQGESSRALLDWEGLTLVRRRSAAKESPAPAPPPDLTQSSPAEPLDWIPG